MKRSILKTVGLLFFLISCNDNNLDKTNREVLVVNLKDPKYSGLKKIELRGDNSQILMIHEGHIKSLENTVAIKGNKNYVNTWYEFDLQNNLIPEESFYYETYLGYYKDTVYVNCRLERHFLDTATRYVLKLAQGDDFSRTRKPFDTTYFDSDFIASIPINSYSNGKNNIKFIIVEEQLKGNRLKQRKTYCDKDFWLK